MVLSLVVLGLSLPTGVLQQAVTDVSPFFYPTIQAVIDSGEVNCDIIPARNTRFPPTITYAYTLNYHYKVGENRYTGSGRIVENTSESIVNEFAKEYRAGLSMPVRYDPQYPDVSTFRPEKLLVDDLMSAVGKLFTFFASVAICILLLFIVVQKQLVRNKEVEQLRQN